MTGEADRLTSAEGLAHSGALPRDGATTSAAAPVGSPLDVALYLRRELPVLPPAAEANVVAMFRERSARFADAPRWRARRDGAWTGMTWRENQAMVNELIAGLHALGARPGARVGILSETRWEWVAADWAILGLGGVCVPVYASQTADTVAYILRDAEVEYLFLQNAEQYEKVMSVRDGIPSLKALIMLDDADRVERAAGLTVISFEALRRLGGLTPEQADALARSLASGIQPEQMASVIYTSGTTNRPKGVIHTHSSLMAQVRCTGAALTTFVPGTTNLLWLPLAHVLGREESFIAVDRGGVTYVGGSTDTLSRDLRETHPNVIVGVPRIYEKAYAAIVERARGSGALQWRIFQWARAVGGEVVDRRRRGETLPAFLRLRYRIADRLVFRKVREALGGALEFSITGGAPIGADILRFLHGAGVLILEGWGLTETMGAVTVNRPDQYRLGSVGLPTMEHQVRIAEDGEALVRGPCVMQGYLNLPTENAAAFDSEGWLRTGDLGVVDADGFVSISGRKKELIILANGKKIGPDPIETLLKAIPGVSQAMVYGDREPYLVALLTLDPASVAAWAKRREMEGADVAAVVASPRFTQHLEEGVARVNGQLARYETVKRFAVAPEDFTVDNGLLTPTQKVKRAPVYARYHALIEGLYARAEQPGDASHGRTAPAPNPG